MKFLFLKALIIWCILHFKKKIILHVNFTVVCFLDKMNLIGNDKGGLYLFDRDIENLTISTAASQAPE